MRKRSAEWSGSNRNNWRNKIHTHTAWTWGGRCSSSDWRWRTYSSANTLERETNVAVHAANMFSYEYVALYGNCMGHKVVARTNAAKTTETIQNLVDSTAIIRKHRVAHIAVMSQLSGLKIQYVYTCSERRRRRRQRRHQIETKWNERQSSSLRFGCHLNASEKCTENNSAVILITDFFISVRSSYVAVDAAIKSLRVQNNERDDGVDSPISPKVTRQRERKREREWESALAYSNNGNYKIVNNKISARVVLARRRTSYRQRAQFIFQLPSC